MFRSKPVTVALAAGILALIAAGCGAPARQAAGPRTVFDSNDGPKPWTNLRFADRDAEFRFAIVSDRTNGARPGVFEQAMGKLNMLHPEFVMCVGDLVQGYTDDPAQAKGQRDELDALVGRLDMPFFYVGGNHDLGTATMMAEWQRRYGRPYYHFIYRDVLFLVLNSETTFADSRASSAASGSERKVITSEQVQYVKDTLAHAGSVR
jgi:hypothetical protein